MVKSTLNKLERKMMILGISGGLIVYISIVLGELIGWVLGVEKSIFYFSAIKIICSIFITYLIYLIVVYRRNK
ncbi:MAG: hypothetical protein ABIH25_05640 [Candidatus Woesearchaeota archaeon]